MSDSRVTALNDPRCEDEIFLDIVNLCARPGFIHAIAALCFRDNIIQFKSEVTGEDFGKLRSTGRLIRNEIDALIGCLVKTEFDWSQPGNETIQEMAKLAEDLLGEYHHRMMLNYISKKISKNKEETTDFPVKGEEVREAVFYAPESAYTFQFREMACDRYARDAQWLVEFKGYSPEGARDICRAVHESQNQKTTSMLGGVSECTLSGQPLLNVYKLEVDDIAARSARTHEEVSAFLSAFTFKDKSLNGSFRQIDDFNEVRTTPILQSPDGDLYLMQYYSLVEATYDSPFYWMMGDKEYFKKSAMRRGEFTEGFLYERLQTIFGKSAVYRNVDVYNGKNCEGEIDCLVLYGEYALLFQAKSKRLTLPARKGKLKNLKNDFQQAVQGAYDQAVKCARAIHKKDIQYRCPDGRRPDLSQIEHVYPICVVADHYPSLAMQAASFLKTVQDDFIGSPFVCDLFLIDIVTEMLPSPLRLVIYVILRTLSGDRVVVNNELSAFGYYLRCNLWLDDADGMVLLDDSLASDLDAAMTVRREGLPGEATPKGILTNLQNTRLGEILAEVEHRPDQFSVGIGLAILEMSGKLARRISKILDRFIADLGRDGKPRDLTILLSHRDAGLTFHINSHDDEYAIEKLRAHMAYRKYIQRTRKWYGIVLDPLTGCPRLAAKLHFPHVFDYRLEELRANAAPGQNTDGMLIDVPKRGGAGRNDPCPCGSGRKYKRCCLNSGRLSH